jgi:riboflavin biosynthesis pyrimidine reductase
MHRSPDDVPTLDFLLPLRRAGEQIPAAPGEPILTSLYRHPAATGEVYVRANMISTLDGAATGPDRVSGSINGAADARVFRVARAAADIVLIGAGTARAEGYGALEIDAELAEARRQRGQGRTLELAVVSADGPLPDRLLDSDRPPYVLTGSARPDLAALRSRIGADRVLVAGTGRSVDLAAGLRQLADLGLGRVLAEGGPHLLGELLGARLVDELCLTTSPMLVAGPAPRIVDSPRWLTPVAARPAHLLHADGVLLGRWLLDDRRAASRGPLPSSETRLTG